MLNNKLNITLIKSIIGISYKNKKIIKSLGLKKINKTVEMPNNKSIQGMLKKVKYLVKIKKNIN